MDAKDLRPEPALGERSSDGSSKYTHIGTALPCSSIKNFPEISSNPLAKGETPTSRPCAIIGPDRVLPTPTGTDAYMRKSHYEPWLSTENLYHSPPEYPHKTYQSPIRNISPRQTFQENMQRIMVAPTYNSVKTNEDTNLVLERNAALPKNKLSGVTETKCCEVPYSFNHLSDTQKTAEMCVSNINNARNCPPIWHPSGVNIRSTRPYGPPDLYQFPEYANCSVSRPMTMTRPQRMNVENNHLFSENFYHHGNIRFKPYPNVKDRYTQARYEYINNYSNPFHPPPPFPRSKYDLQKPVPPHASYPQVPIKYLDNRINDSVLEGYQRSNQQLHYNAPYQNQMIHPAYGPVLPNNIQNKFYPYTQDKAMPVNKLPFENNKLYVDYDNTLSKNYPIPENIYINEAKSHVKSQVIIPNYTMNMQHVPPHPYYRKENITTKGYDYVPHFSINTNNHMSRMAPQFSPNTVAISPSDSNTSNETTHTQLLEDSGYVSQSSSASIRSGDSGIHRVLQNDIHRRYSYGYPSMVRPPPFVNKMQSNVDSNITSKDKKGIDVRQFLQMWNEGDDENAVHSNEAQIKYNHNPNKSSKQFEEKTQEELYVLGLVNVPSDELAKYEHIQKVSKLPDNIKGYNNIELLKQFEEAIESSNLNNFNINKTSMSRNFQSPKSSITSISTRPISPLDVEAKISQSVIHKEVGCNFEIKPCSPEMLNVEVAAPVRNILEERVIEKVSNPYQSPTLSTISDNGRNFNVPNQDKIVMLNENSKIPSCKLVNTQCPNNNALDVIRSDYTLNDLESSSGVCLASLPRLDNDIELNFPEVNQQFINANKETVITSNESQMTSEVKKSNLSINTSNSSDLDTNIVIEKEFSKLSKYRKNKKFESDIREQSLVPNSQYLRTDSVIMKNPENTKCFEDIVVNRDKSQNNELLLSPLNMLHCKPDINTAIDFSVSKSEPETTTPLFAGNNNSSSCCSDNLFETKKEILQSNTNSLDLDSYNIALTSNILVEDVTPNFSDMHKNSKTPLHCNEEIKKNLAPLIETEAAHRTTDKIHEEDAVLGLQLCDSSNIINKEDECGLSPKKYIERKLVKSSDHSTNLIVPVIPDHIEKTKTEGTNSSSESSSKNPDTVHDSYVNKVNDAILNENDFIMIEPESISQENPNDSVPLSNPCSKHKISNNRNIGSQDKIKVKRYHPNTFEPLIDNSASDNSNKPSHNIKSMGEIKSSNLKKELYSPWIRKLLIQSGDILLKTKPVEENITEMTTKSILSHVRDYCISTICSEETTNINEKCNLPRLEDFNEGSSIINDDSVVQSVNIPMEMSKDKCCTGLEDESLILTTEDSSLIKLSKKDGLVDKNIMMYTSNESHRSPSEYVEVVDNKVKIVMNLHTIENIEEINETTKGSDAENNTVTDETTKSSNNCEAEEELEKGSVKHCKAENLKNITLEQNTVFHKDNYMITDKTTKGTSSYGESLDIYKEFEKSNVKHSKAENCKNITPQLNEICQIVTDKITKGSNNYVVSESLDTSEGFEKTNVKHSNSEIPYNISPEQNKVFQQDNNVKKYGDVAINIPSNENKNKKVDAKNKFIESSNCTNDSVNDVPDKDFDSICNQYSLCLQKNGGKLKSLDYVCEKQSNVNNSAINESANITTENSMYESCENYNEKVEKNTLIISKQEELLNENQQDEVDHLSTTEKTGPNDYKEAIEKDISITDSQSKHEFEKDGNMLCSSNLSGDIECPIKISETENNLPDTEFGSCTSQTGDGCLTYNTNIITEKTVFNSDNQPAQDNCRVKNNSKILCFSEYNEIIESPINTSHNSFSSKECDSKNKEIHLSSHVDFELSVNKEIEKNNNNHEYTNNPDILFCQQNIKSQEGIATDERNNENESQIISRGDKERNDFSNNGNEINTLPEDVVVHLNSATLVGTNNARIIAEQDNVGFIRKNCFEVESNHVDDFFEQRRRNLKRSLSDSALDMINPDISDEFGNGVSTWSKRRRKNKEYINVANPDFLSQIQNHRRNSISSLYNEDDLSFCIVIDEDYVIAQGDAEKICFTEELSDSEVATIGEDMTSSQEIVLCHQDVPSELSESFVLEISDENDINKTWLDDIGCIETVVSDDVAEDVTVSASCSPKNENVSDDDGGDDKDKDVFNSTYEHTDKVKYIYGEKMCNDDAEFVDTLYRTPQMNVNKTLSNRESHTSDDYEFDEYDYLKKCFDSSTSSNELNDNTISFRNDDDIHLKLLEHHQRETINDTIDTVRVVKTQDDTVNSCESSIDNVFLYKEESDPLNVETPSSPEVSSTTSDEKSSSILLKITNYKGMMTSQINKTDIETSSKNCCKFTENVNYTNINSSKSRPLITKGAQKYIPPINETLDDLKVKLPLPQHSLLKFKQLKLDRTAPKQVISQKREIPKKLKPKFEDVLKSIDEIQFKRHKEKNKRLKKSVPKVIIKKNENGSHYASVPAKTIFNPDLTGRKWQPWVFIEKNSFIDKMANKKKTKAIFNHRKKSYVLADKFQKYKSESSAKFIITQPKLDNPTTGQLKYTIKLKHT